MLIDWPAAKFWIVDHFGLTNDLLHVYGGVAIQLLVCVLLRLPLRATMPLLFVAMLELFNEVSDLIIAAARINADYVGGMLWDFGNSLAMPTLLFGLSHCKRLFV